MEEEIDHLPGKKTIGGIKSDENMPFLLKCLPMAKSRFGFLYRCILLFLVFYKEATRL